MVICKNLCFEEKEMARIYPPNQKIQSAKSSTFRRFPPNAQNSCREPCNVGLQKFSFSYLIDYAKSMYFEYDLCTMYLNNMQSSNHKY